MQITITAEGVTAICACLTLLGAVALWIVNAMIQAAMLKQREWINGSFMRTATVEAKMSGFDARLEHVEINGCDRRAEHE